ncbi:alkaline phosphatase PafA [Mesonia sp. HuA40]|uniref:alkaline phosphatase PafA n=1 Tax=Mesonia sp. HuA40 TaxID=2602761 RepID=UPI0011CCAAFB|nr:alkaline phosphatase PafA [Mesonia sp. HuA40]TXK73409.1 alkaline phosphatase family protein [Mesonia sp. HuA40]
MKKFSLLLLLGFLLNACASVENLDKSAVVDKEPEQSLYAQPKLVVGVVVDQMRYDYLTRFWDLYTDRGFKRLINQGFNCKNNHYNYVPTYTAPGHASVFTGTSPQVHGIIANNWYDKQEKKKVYCVDDNTVNGLGTTLAAGQMSPKRLETTSIADQNRLHTQFRGKSIGIAIKDRGAILPAGHSANAAYWFLGGEEGKWISSSYYMNELPSWVQNFNANEPAKKYLNTWNTLLPIAQYTQSGSDANAYEFGFKGKENPDFPYNLAKLAPENGGYDILKATPFGNSLTLDFALAAIENEALGKDQDTDFLTLSFSSPDYIGHNFGVNAKEIQDNYLRLDLEIAKLLEYLDTHIGKGEYTLFLTADHGAIHVPNYLKDQKIPAGYVSSSDLKKRLKNYLGEAHANVNLIENTSNNQLFLNHELIQEKNIDALALAEDIKAFLLAQPEISRVFTRSEIEMNAATEKTKLLVQNGFHQKRSGDLVFGFLPNYISYPEKGSTHGTGFNYDTHAPLLFYGKGIRKGSSFNKTYITDIAPTIAALLGIANPNGTTGEVIVEVLD